MTLKNLKLLACRGPYPDDTQYITTVTAAGDFPRTIGQLAQIYDPRQWDVNHNPYATHFLDVHPVSSVNGQTAVSRPEPIGASWASPSFILENVAGVSGTSLANTLSIEFIATPGSLNLTYDLGRTTASSSTLVMERDFGHITVKPVPGRAGWSRVEVEKNIRFSGNTGTSGGDIGWGDLANLLAPDLVAHWLHDMRYMPCA